MFLLSMIGGGNSKSMLSNLAFVKAIKPIKYAGVINKYLTKF